MDVTVVIVRQTVLRDSQPLTLILSNTINFVQQQPDAVLLFIMDYLAHKSDNKGTAQKMRMVG